jgi:lysophospholipase L1-like esterase
MGKNKFKIIALLAVIVLTLLCVEIPFRIYDSFKYSHMFKGINQKTGKVAVSFDEVQVYLYKTGKCARDPDLIWKYTSRLKDFKINSLGIRGSEIPLNKPSSTFRIFVFGGSHPFGLGVDYEDTYAKQLEKMFSEHKMAGIGNVQVINAAVPGYASLQVLKFLKRDIIPYHPDLVIIDVGTNDMIELTKNWPLKDNEIPVISPFMCKVSNILYRSSFFWYYKKFLNGFIKRNVGNFDSLAEKRTRATPGEYRENLRKMSDLAKKEDFRILFLTQMVINSHGELVDPLKGYYIEPKVDIYGFFKEKEKDINKYMLDNIHGSKLGHKEIASILFDYLSRNKLEPQ